MDTTTATSQSSPCQQYLSSTDMMKVVLFNVGGKLFKVSCSLFDTHPNSLLAKCASKQWLSDPDGEISLQRDGHRFRFVLDYLRAGGHVTLPVNVSHPLFLADLSYYGIENVDASKVTYHFGTAFPCLSDIENEVRTKMRAEIQAWQRHHTIALLTKECASQHMTSGGKLLIEIDDPEYKHKTGNSILDSSDTWVAVVKLLYNNGNKFPLSAHEECNKYLAKVGLQIISVRKEGNAILVTMQLSSLVHQSASP